MIGTRDIRRVAQVLSLACSDETLVGIVYNLLVVDDLPQLTDAQAQIGRYLFDYLTEFRPDIVEKASGQS
jgi:hypothetical protein